MNECQKVGRASVIAGFAFTCAFALVVSSCGGKAPASPRLNGDSGVDGPGGAAGTGGSHDAGHDAPASDATCGVDALTKKPTGQACSCASDCPSNF